MSRDRRHDWDAPDYIEAGHVDDDSSSSDDVANAVNYVPPYFPRTEKRKALGIANPLRNIPISETLVNRKFQKRQE